MSRIRAEGQAERSETMLERSNDYPKGALKRIKSRGVYFIGLFFNQIDPENGKILTISPISAPSESSGR